MMTLKGLELPLMRHHSLRVLELDNGPKAVGRKTSHFVTEVDLAMIGWLSQQQVLKLQQDDNG
jgi:hypothetical protein